MMTDSPSRRGVRSVSGTEVTIPLAATSMHVLVSKHGATSRTARRTQGTAEGIAVGNEDAHEDEDDEDEEDKVAGALGSVEGTVESVTATRVACTEEPMADAQ